MTDSKYKSLIDDCLKEECDCSHWCLLKEIVMSSKKFDPRFLVQTKCIEIFKWHKGRKLGKDIGWASAWELWVEEGYAKAFADAFDANPKMSPQELYKKTVDIIGKKPEDNT